MIPLYYNKFFRDFLEPDGKSSGPGKRHERGMVYITGDIHGDFSRFTSPAAKRLKAGIFLAVCGDFGFFWDDSKQERRLRDKLEKLPYTIAFLDGRHENFTLLDQYPVTEWNGGRVQEVAKNLLHLMREGKSTKSRANPISSSAAEKAPTTLSGRKGRLVGGNALRQGKSITGRTIWRKPISRWITC